MPLREVALWNEFQDNSSNKRSKFVVTGHGKYEKVLDDNNDGCDDTNCLPGKIFNQWLKVNGQEINRQRFSFKKMCAGYYI